MEVEDTLGNILMLLEFEELITLIQTNKQIYNYLTTNKVFWINKINQDFLFIPDLDVPYYKTYEKLITIRSKVNRLLMNNVYFNIDDCNQLDTILPIHIRNKIQINDCNLVMNLGLSYFNQLNNQYYPAFISYGDYDDVIQDNDLEFILLKLLYYYPNTQIYTH
jgi:hypothetical protein